MNIIGNKVTLRAIEIGDMGFIKDMFNDPELERFVVGWAFPLSEYNQLKWFEAHAAGQKDQRFIIETPEDGAVGVATLTNIDWKNRSATHGIKLANRDLRGRGIGTDTVMAIMRYAFDELGLHRLDGAIFEDNAASLRLYEKCGWRREGLKRECVYKGGEWKNLVAVGILESDYRDLAAATHYFNKSLQYNKLNGGGYYVSRIRGERVIDLVIESCDEAFETPIRRRKGYPEILGKICRFGEFLVAHTDRNLGYAAYYANDHKAGMAYLTLIAVSPGFQRRGIGGDLMGRFESVARERGLALCKLEVARTNGKALAFYEARGYHITEKAGLDSLYMEKRLTEA